MPKLRGLDTLHVLDPDASKNRRIAIVKPLALAGQDVEVGNVDVFRATEGKLRLWRDDPTTRNG